MVCQVVGREGLSRVPLQPPQALVMIVPMPCENANGDSRAAASMCRKGVSLSTRKRTRNRAIIAKEPTPEAIRACGEVPGGRTEERNRHRAQGTGRGTEQRAQTTKHRAWCRGHRACAEATGHGAEATGHGAEATGLHGTHREAEREGQAQRDRRAARNT